MTRTPVWNWKSAVASTVCRAALFFAINLPAGLDAAVVAMQVELLYRAVAAGFYGSLTQYFSRLHQERQATWTALLVVPGLAHLVEGGVHAWAGTPQLAWSLAGSITFSIITTRFSLFAMRRGVLTVGSGSASCWQDLRALPALVVAFFRVP
jgi:hypothetical protein